MYGKRVQPKKTKLTMKANELRIGNLIYNVDRREPVEVTASILQDLTIWNSGVIYAPIPLTEEWLDKFGFVKNNHRYSINNFVIANYGGVWGVDISDDLGTNLKHVHQLQNLYFALTGEELTIKQ